MRVRAPQTQDINNIADVLSDAFDPNFANNHAEVRHAITDVADLQVTKTALGEVQVIGPAGTGVRHHEPGGVPDRAELRYVVDAGDGGPADPVQPDGDEQRSVGRGEHAAVRPVAGGGDAGAGDAGDRARVNCETGTPGEPLDRLTCGLGMVCSRGGRRR